MTTLKVINVIAKLDRDNHEDLIDEIICNSIDSGLNAFEDEEDIKETIFM